MSLDGFMSLPFPYPSLNLDLLLLEQVPKMGFQNPRTENTNAPDLAWNTRKAFKANSLGVF